MMQYLLVLAVVAVASADVSVVKSPEAEADIVKATYDSSPEGGFQYSYETGNGIAAEANGVVKTDKTDYPAIEITGNVKYTSPEGEPIELTYIANENGYQPQGSHLPVAPPVPDQIIRSIEYIKAHPPPVAKQ